jgi:hypothetical protein
MKEIFGKDNFFLEVQLVDAKNSPEMIRQANIIRELAQHTKTKCIATGETIAGHKRRYCPKCRAVYQKQYRERITKMVKAYKNTIIMPTTVKEL